MLGAARLGRSRSSSRTLQRSELGVGLQCRKLFPWEMLCPDLGMGGLCPESLLMAAEDQWGTNWGGPWRRQAQPSLKACSLGENASSGWKPAQKRLGG